MLNATGKKHSREKEIRCVRGECAVLDRVVRLDVTEKEISKPSRKR